MLGAQATQAAHMRFWMLMEGWVTDGTDRTDEDGYHL